MDIDNLGGPTERANQKKNDDRSWPIIVAHDRISVPEKNYDRKNLSYRCSSLSRNETTIILWVPTIDNNH